MNRHSITCLINMLDQILELGQLIRTKLITSEELTGIFLKRLKRYHELIIIEIIIQLSSRDLVLVKSFEGLLQIWPCPGICCHYHGRIGLQASKTS